MRKSYLLYKMSVIALIAVGLQSCKKENGIDNDTVVKKPYGLYVGEEDGSLLNTNDGQAYKTIFPPDGFASRALTTSGNNIIWAKANVHLSEDNGKNFNPTYFLTNAFYLGIRPYIPWQQIILDVPSHDRVYICSSEGKGIALSIDHGKTWKPDTLWDDGISNTIITSLTQLKNGSLFAHNLSDNSVYKRDNKDDRWTKIETTTALTPGIYYLSHFNNTLVATDIAGVSGAFFSNDEGRNWTAYTGLPNRLLYTTATPFDQTLLVGTDSQGVYRLDNGQFVPSNNGLETYTTVYAILGKDDIYKNNATKRYVYMATNKGLYRSEDLGQNWVLVKEGSYVALY